MQAIDFVKLKATAEHLEWVLRQYPDSDDVQSLLRALTPLIEDAKAWRIKLPMDGMKVPGAWNFGDGRYIPYANPNVDGAYSGFVDELEGGLTDEEKQRIARLDAMRRVMGEGSSS